jgi:YD repeat-containing protein
MSSRSVLALASGLIALGSAPMALAEHEEYDEAGRLVRSVDDEGNETLYRYDEEGNLVEKRDGETVERIEVDPEAAAD